MSPVLATFSILGGVIGIVSFLGAVAVYLRGSVDKGTIVALQANNKALAERVALLEKANDEQSGRLKALERENDVLLAQRPSAEILADLDHKLDEHHEQTMRILGGVPHDV